MAKARYQKRSGAGKVAAAIAAILLIAIIAFGAVWGTGFALTGKANPAEWGTICVNRQSEPRGVGHGANTGRRNGRAERHTHGRDDGQHGIV